MRSMRNCFLFLLLAGFVMVTAALSQQKITTAKVSIPFDFWVGDKKFPAGEYTLDSSVPTFLTMRNRSGSINEQAPTILNGDPVEKKDARLVFVNRNGKYYLNELRGVLGRRTITSEYGRSTPQYGAREIAISYP